MNNKTSKIFINIYILLWCIYNLQGTLYSSGGWLSQSVLMVLFTVSLYYFFYANLKYKLPGVLKALSIIVVVFSIYGFIRIIQNEQIIITENYYTIKSWDYLKNILMSLLPVYTIYIGTKCGGLTEIGLQRWIIVFLLVGIAGFYSTNAFNLAVAMASGSMREEFTNNSAYAILSIVILIPLFYKRPLLQYLFLGICIYYVLIGMKRGALLIGAVSILWFLFYLVRNNKSAKQKTWSLLLTMVVVFMAVYLINNLLESSDYFNTRIERTLEGDSSHRDELYGAFFDHFLGETNMLHFLFGNGADATIKISTNYAHNDWLEIAINNGAVMLILYLAYWIVLFRTARKAKENAVCFMILNLYFIIYFLRSWFSMSYADISIYASTALGYALAINQYGETNIEQ